jgi:hypothetical protein
MKSYLICVAGVLLCSLNMAHATSITILNPSFELDTPTQGATAGITDWTYTTGDASTYYPPTSEFATVPQGHNVAAVDGPYSISQTLTATLTDSTEYQLEVYVGARGDGYPYGGYIVDLYAGSTLLA